MIKEIIKYCFFLPTAIYNRIILWHNRVVFGKEIIISGRIYCVAGKTGKIKIGNTVRINSGMRYNPIGGDCRTILFADEGGDISIGNNVGMSNCAIISKASVSIEDGVMLGGGVKIYDSDFHWLAPLQRKTTKGGKKKPVVIKEDAFIGAHCIILKGVTIGRGAVIGAGSVVTRDVPDYEVWAGNPAIFRHCVEE